MFLKEQQQVAQKEGVDLYVETEVNQDGFDTKMNPTRIVEKNWDHSYKLSQLIDQQEKMMDQDAFFLTMIKS